LPTKAKPRPGPASAKQPPLPRLPVAEISLAWTVAILLALLPILGGKRESPLGLIAEGGLLLLFALGIASVLRRRKIPFELHWLDVALLAWVAIAALSCIRSVSLDRSLLMFGKVLAYAGAFFLGRFFAEREPLTRLLLAGVAVGALLSAGIGLQSYVMNVAVLANPGWRIFGPFINPNAFAGYLLVAIPVLLFLALHERRGILRACFLVMLLMAAAALLLTGSKGGVLAGLLAAAFLLARLAIQARPSLGRARLLVPLFVGVVIILGALAFAAPPMRERIVSAATETHSAVFRAYTWLGTLRTAAARPVLGWGVGTFESVFPQFAIAGYTWSSHNDYLQTAAETGFLGLAAYLLFLGGFLWESRRASEHGPRLNLPLASSVAVLGFCLHTLVDSDFPILATGATLWLLMGVARTPLSTKMPKEHPPLSRRGAIALSGLLALSFVLTGYCLSTSYARSKGRLGELELNGGRISAATRYLDQAVRFAPLDSHARRNLAEALFQDGLSWGGKDSLDRAEREAGTAATLDRMRPTNWSVWGRIVAVRGLRDKNLERQEAGAALLRRSAQLAPNDPHGWLTLADFRFRQSTQMADSNSGLHEKWRAEALSSLKRIQQIEDSPAGKVRAIPDLVDLDFSRARLYLGREALATGDLEQVIASCNFALQEVQRYRSSKSVEALQTLEEEPYRGVERLQAMALLLRGEAERMMGDRARATEDGQAGLAAWSDAAEPFQSFLKGDVLP